MAKSYAGEMDTLINAVLAKAPVCLENKALLSAIDWSRVAPEKIAPLLANLDKAGQKVPPSLLSALVIAGHVVDDARLEHLSLPLKLLNRLNTDTTPDEPLIITASDVAARTIEDAELALALVRRLKEKGLVSQALQLALSNREAAPQLLRPVAKALREHISRLEPVRLRLLGTSTTHPFAEDLVPAFAANGFRAEIDEANFGEVMPELLRPASKDYDAFFLLLDMEGFHPHEGRSEPGAGMQKLTERLDLLASALAGFAERSPCPVFVNSLPLPAAPAVGYLDSHHADGAAAQVLAINARLGELAGAHNQIILVDSFAAFANIAPSNWQDPKMWFYGRIPYGPEASRALAGSFARAVRIGKKGLPKVLAIDLDNTMWGGIFGEDGVQGLQCGDDFPGNAFKAMQNEFLRLKRQGMILALLSKNNPEALTAFADHPGIIMTEDDFAAHRINWTPKPQNIRELAREINVGLDSFIFLDDSPHEREAMRALAPEVHTPELPDDPARRPSWLRALSATWPVRLTKEDSERANMYLARRKASEMKSSATSFEDYLAGLEQKLLVEEVSEATLPRIAQMHQKTNQFNLTTRRFDEADIRAMMDDPGAHRVFLGRVSDKFGDHGISICATVAIEGSSARLKTLLMSCRVIGREVEAAFLGAVLEKLRENDVETVHATYRPTEKNLIVADFYGEQGFERLEKSADETRYEWNARTSPLPGSSHVEIIWPA